MNKGYTKNEINILTNFLIILTLHLDGYEEKN